MTVKEEVKKEERKLNEERLTDLPVGENESADTKGGQGHEDQIQILSWQFGTSRGIGQP